MTERERGSKWRRISARVLRRDLLCVHCLARTFVTPSVVADHIVPIFKGGADMDESNLQGLCAECHAVKTAAERGYVEKGCDANGMPTSAAHHWNR